MSQYAKLYQSQQLRQEMKINPRLYQAMELLYMPLLDLQQHVTTELAENPFLEMSEADVDSDVELKEEADEPASCDYLEICSGASCSEAIETATARVLPDGTVFHIRVETDGKEPVADGVDEMARTEKTAVISTLDQDGPLTGRKRLGNDLARIHVTVVWPVRKHHGIPVRQKLRVVEPRAFVIQHDEFRRATGRGDAHDALWLAEENRTAGGPVQP